MSGPGDWLQFYHQNLSSTAATPPSAQPTSTAVIFDDRLSDATAISSAAVGGTAGETAGSTNLNRGSRVSRPVRRRSRVSRRTPTTLLNTDTTNFRAMVQQFTGGPTPPFASSISPNFSLGLGGTVRQSSFGPPPQFYHSNPQPFGFPASQHGGEFLQRLGGVAGDGFLMESVISSQIPFAGRGPADSSKESNGDNGGGLLF